MKHLRRTTMSLTALVLTACAAGNGLQVVAAHDEKLRVERNAQTLVNALPVNVSRRSFRFQIAADDRASVWNIAPGVIVISQTTARHATDDELIQLIAHGMAHDLLAHPVAETGPSGAREAAENIAIAAVPGGILLAGGVEGIAGNGAYTLAHEIDAERIGLRLWLYSGRTCATWIALRQAQRTHGRSWHEPIKDVTPPFDDLMRTAQEECVGQR
ncbi:MAG: hypothetical protein FIA90_04900 [candidate division NC10 bacterium]|nr:hypothetical protein [candidate division NC10 bacterium]